MKPWLLWAIRIVFAAAGIGVVVYLILRVGPDRVLDALLDAAPWLPLALLLQSGRIVCDAVGTYLALGEKRHSVPISRVIRAQLIGSASGHILPGGRLSEEGTKVALLIRYTGGGAAAAAGVTNEAVTLIAGAMFSVPCALAAFHLQAETLLWALLAHGVVLFGIGVAIRALMRNPPWLSRLRNRFSWLPEVADSFVATARHDPLIPGGPLLAMLAARVFEGSSFVILAHAAGIHLSLAEALVVLGIQMISVAVGSLVPGQLGVGEVAFSLWAGALGAAPAAALAVPLSAHLIQMSFVPVGALTPIVWPNRDPRPPAAETPT